MASATSQSAWRCQSKRKRSLDKLMGNCRATWHGCAARAVKVRLDIVFGDVDSIAKAARGRRIPN